MLLRSVTKHIKEQNWFAVFIDFLIVVVGVFIGIQVSNWNTDRADRLLEAETLVALHEDIKATANSIAHVLIEAEVADDSLRVLAEFADGQHDDMDIPTIDQHILAGVYAVLGFEPIMVTYDELKNTGRLRLLKEQQLRKQLQIIDSQITTLKTDENAILKASYDMSDLFLIKNYDWRGFITIPSRDGSYSVNWLDPMKDRRDPKDTLRQIEFMNILFYRGRLNESFKKSAKTLSVTLAEIDALIAQRLASIGQP
ncbi:hypothetical protein [Marinicella litoralis]|nr:hypothetical protein [Marinicella litoralis]